jgi:hypothetical protein
VVTFTALIAATGSAGAATRIGETFQPTDNCSPRTRLQSSSPGAKYAAPFSGVITSWSFQSSSAAGESPVRFKVGRHAGGDDFTIVGESEGKPIPDLDALHTFPVRIPVVAGDVIGLYTAPPSVFYCARPAAGHVVHQSAFGEDVALGAPATFSPVNDLQLDVSAALEHDCDKDGLGDETQDPNLSACATGQRAAAIKKCKKKYKGKAKAKKRKKCIKKAKKRGGVEPFPIEGGLGPILPGEPVPTFDTGISFRPEAERSGASS